MSDLNHISHDIIQASIQMHKELGPRLLESIYRKYLAKVLRDMGRDVQEERYLPVKFRGEISGGKRISNRYSYLMKK